MLFSIVLPIYKVEKYLRECVNSVLNQSFEDFEVILVDDGSPDNCPQICDEYARNDCRVKVIHQKNAGLACARNSGIRVASGDYVVCIDSDDYLKDNDILQKIADKAENGADVILYGYQKLFESTHTFGECNVPVLEGKCTTSEMLRNVLDNNTYCGTAWTKAVKLKIIHDYNIEFRPGMISEDIDWYLHILCRAETFDSINDVAIIYRQRPGSISHAPKLNSLIDNLWILDNWPNRFERLIQNRELVDLLYAVMAYYYANDLILYANYPVDIVKRYKDRLKNKCYLLDYAVTPRALTIKRFYMIFGFGITILFLGIISKLKTKQ